jgi:hypothetical protein
MRFREINRRIESINFDLDDLGIDMVYYENNGIKQTIQRKPTQEAITAMKLLDEIIKTANSLRITAFFLVPKE